MKKTVGLLLAALMFVAALATAQALSLKGEASALDIGPLFPDIDIPGIKFTFPPLLTLTPKPTINFPDIKLPDFPIDIGPILPDPDPTAPPTPTPTPAPVTPAPDPMPTAPALTDKPTSKPTRKPEAPMAQASKGAEVTSFGPYFEELRPKLTDKWYLFTPLDLAVEGMLTYPMIANNATIVGNVIITVAGGQLTVTYQPAPGVTTTREFFTLFPSLDAIQTLNVELLSARARPFGQPIDIQQAFGGDRKVILYLNNLADFDAAKSGLAAFVPEQHRAFMQNLLPLLD